MRAFRSSVIALLLYSMTTASGEIAEHIIHMITEGHSVHEHIDHTADKEHGCSGPYHMCVCHSTILFVVSAPAVETMPVHGNPNIFALVEQVEGDSHQRSLFRPPIT
jgi:hypothetical protein